MRKLGDVVAGDGTRILTYKTKRHTESDPLTIHISRDRRTITGFSKLHHGLEQTVSFNILDDTMVMGFGQIKAGELLTLMYTIFQPSGTDNLELMQEVYNIFYAPEDDNDSSCNLCQFGVDTSEWKADHEWDNRGLDRDFDIRYQDKETLEIICSECYAAKESLLGYIEKSMPPSAHEPNGWGIDLLTMVEGNMYTAIRLVFDAYYHVGAEQLLEDLKLSVEEDQQA